MGSCCKHVKSERYQRLVHIPSLLQEEYGTLSARVNLFIAPAESDRGILRVIGWRQHVNIGAGNRLIADLKLNLGEKSCWWSLKKDEIFF